MPDHVYPIRDVSKVSMLDHLRSHMLETVLLLSVLVCSSAILYDGLWNKQGMPSFGSIPTWVQLVLGSLLIVGVVLAFIGMTWRPRPKEVNGEILVFISRSFDVERLGWTIIMASSVGVAIAFAQTGPWFLSTTLALLWATESIVKIIALTLTLKLQQAEVKGGVVGVSDKSPGVLKLIRFRSNK